MLIRVRAHLFPFKHERNLTILYNKYSVLRNSHILLIWENNISNVVEKLKNPISYRNLISNNIFYFMYTKQGFLFQKNVVYYDALNNTGLYENNVI